MLQRYRSDVNLVCYENIVETLSIKQFLQQYFKTITVLIGPESGFTPHEIAVLSSYQYYPISLGKLILRDETATVALLAMIYVWKRIIGEGKDDKSSID